MYIIYQVYMLYHGICITINTGYLSGERKGSLDAELAFTDSPDQNKAYLKSNAADTESDLNMSVDVMDLNISMVEDHEDQCLANSTNCTVSPELLVY